MLKPRYSSYAAIQLLQTPLLIALIILGFSACSAPPDYSDPAQVIDASVDVHGGKILNKAHFTFDFRDRQFSITRNDGVFAYTRSYEDTTGAAIKETLSNSGLERFIDGQLSVMDDDLYRRMETSVNSVSYFALLPLPLQDPAVVKKHMGEVEILGQPYYKIDVTFEQEGGGRDYQDRFLYWFHTEHFTMDYMAYYFYTDEEGSRFRQATNQREINGVLVQDYLNFKYDDLTIETIDQYDQLFNEGSLELVSEVNLDNVVIEKIRD